MKKLIALVCAFCLCFVLAACGSGSVNKDEYLGTWNLESSTSEALSEESINTMKEYGLIVTLELNDDGTGVLNLFGEKIDVEWTADKPPVEITINGGTGTLTRSGDTLTMTDTSNAELKFVKAQ